MQTESTGYLTIGNSDNRLSQKEWSEFCAELLEVVEDLGTGIFGPYYTAPAAPYQSMCIGFTIPSANHVWSEVMKAVAEHSARLCLKYRQESIAYVEGQPYFYTAPEPDIKTLEAHDAFVIDPICRELNPGLDEWNGACCRFPKSCSPYMTQESLDRRVQKAND